MAFANDVCEHCFRRVDHDLGGAGGDPLLVMGLPAEDMTDDAVAVLDAVGWPPQPARPTDTDHHEDGHRDGQQYERHGRRRHQRAAW
jgi:hypothetical protein